MDIFYENPSHTSSGPPRVKSANTSNQNRRKLADVGNTIHQTAKNLTSVHKATEMNIRQNDSASCRNTSTCFERRITLEKTEHLDEADLIVVADLNPRYFYDDEIEDLHEDCSVDLMIDEVDSLLQQNLRLNSDDFESLTCFKPIKTSWDDHFDNVDGYDSLYTMDDLADLDNLDILFDCPSDGKFLSFSYPFNDFIVPGIDLDFLC
ncbi:unnamed protein product [Bemisia tabaci]|uniref:Uncharacterized protein n=1 Tax=Bemisia tabaci TaxID=7038 RepID=A0A9P0A867_BEMTA|nr:unnamed protein product [Bemisia tabaci]